MVPHYPLWSPSLAFCPAPIGSLAATEQARKLCEGYFVFKSLGPTKFKGVSGPVEVYEVTGQGPIFRVVGSRMEVRKATAAAKADSWREVLEFLADLTK
jgi:hypothetical protein